MRAPALGLALLAATLLCAPAFPASVIGTVPVRRAVGALQNLISEDGYHFLRLDRDNGREAVVFDGSVVDSGPSGTFVTYKDADGHEYFTAGISRHGRYAYARRARDADGNPGESVILDGRSLGVFKEVSDFLMSPTGHLAFSAKKPQGGWWLYLDGHSINRLGDAAASGLSFTPAGDQVYYILLDAQGEALYIGAKRLRPWIGDVVDFSANFTHYYAQQLDPSGKMTETYLDDKLLGSYVNVLHEAFAQQRLLYMAQPPSPTSSPHMQMYDQGRPIGPPMQSEAYGTFEVSPNGQAHWIGQLSGGGWFHFIDGQQAESTPGPGDSWPVIVFSPSGEHSAYATGGTIRVDGSPQSAIGYKSSGADGNAFRIAFDNENEFHFIDLSAGRLVCASVADLQDPGQSTCLQKARAIYGGAAQ